MNNIKKIYQHAGKCDDKQNLKDIIDISIMSTIDRVKDNIPNESVTSIPVKKTSARKLLGLFTKILDVEPKTAKHSFMDTKSKDKALKVVSNLWTKRTKRKGNSKINE